MPTNSTAPTAQWVDETGIPSISPSQTEFIFSFFFFFYCIQAFLQQNLELLVAISDRIGNNSIHTQFGAEENSKSGAKFYSEPRRRRNLQILGVLYLIRLLFSRTIHVHI